MSLNIVWLNSKLNKPQPSIIRKADGHGLGVRISKNGKITFTFRYRYQNKQTSVDLGSYPLLSLVDARRKADEYRQALEEGKDPSLINGDRSTEYVTFQDYAEAWYLDYFQYKKTGKEVMNQLRLHLYPTLGGLVVEKTTTYHWMEKIKQLRKTTSLASSSFYNKVNRISQILTYATKHFKLNYNPTQGITGSDFNASLKDRARFHSDAELTQIIELLWHKKLQPHYRRFTLLVMLTGCRVAELNLAEIKDFNFREGWWRIPEEKSKNQKEFFRALTPYMIEIIQEQMASSPGARYLFSAIRDYNAPYCDLNKVVGPKLRELGRQTFEDYADDWVMHDFRRSIRTRLGDWVDDKVAELTIGHKQTGVKAIYDRNKYLPKMLEGYLAWEAHLRELGLK